MKIILLALTLSLSACSLFEKKPDAPDSPTQPDCKQQPLEPLPRDPEIPCKRGDWWAPGHSTCSSTLEKCLNK